MKNVTHSSKNFSVTSNGAQGAKNILAIILLLLLAIGSTVQAQSDDPIFSDILEIQRKPEAKPSTIRSRFTTLNKEQVVTQRETSKEAAQKSRVQLNLFEDVDLMAVFEQVKQNDQGGYTSIGQIEGDEDSHVIWVERNNVVAATIRTAFATYQVKYAGNGVHIIEEVDLTQFPKEVKPIPVHTDFDEDDPVPTGGDSGCRIDVLVFYTTAAKNGAGGNNGIWTRIQLGVAEANDAYSNSGITAQLNLKAMLELEYNETGNFSTDLARLQNPSDGYLDSAHSLRDSYGADLVSLITNTGDGCGLGYVMCNPSTGFEDWAFSVVREDCISPNYSFVHELGHNMGCTHAPVDLDPGDCGAYSYSRGYKNYSNNWRTIMAYSPGTRILRFSNPNVKLPGEFNRNRHTEQCSHD